jgi:hypothetical protein
MSTALITCSFTAAATMVALWTPGRHNLAQASVLDNKFALAERCVR